MTMNIYRTIIGLILMLSFFLVTTPTKSNDIEYPQEVLAKIYTATPITETSEIEEYLYLSTYWYDLDALENLITIFRVTPSMADQIYESYLADGTAVKVPEGYAKVKYLGDHMGFQIYEIVR